MQLLPQQRLLSLEPLDDEPSSYQTINISSLPDEQEPIELSSEEQLVELARQGDTEACHNLLTYVYGRVVRLARWYYGTYRWASASLDWEDLAHDAYERMILRLDYALAANNPIAYLIGIARTEIGRICHSRASDPETLSTDSYIGDAETRLADIIAENGLPIPAYGANGKDYQHLYQAIDQLPQTQRMVIQRLYGIGEHAPEELAKINQSLGWHRNRAGRYNQEALAALYVTLAETYSDYAQESPSLLQYRPKETNKETVFISDQRRNQLDTAYAALESRGGKIDYQSLQQETHLQRQVVGAYLRERRASQPLQVSRQQRLDEAYDSLLAREEKVSIKALSKEGRVDFPIAKLYLQTKNQPSLETASM